MKPKEDPRSDITKTLGIEPSSDRRRRWRRWLMTVAVIIGAVITGLVLARTDQPDTAQYRTEEARQGDLIVGVTATGNLEPTNQVDVGTELSGTVRSVDVDYNDRVKIDQVLARLDTSKLQAQNLQYKAALASAKAKVLQTQATVKEATSNLKRLRHVRELSGNKSPSQSEIDAAQATLDRAEADEASAKAAISEAQAVLEANETDLEKSVIRSPINGVVLSRSVEPGQTVAASLQAPVLFTLAEDLTQMELHVDVDEADVGQVREGQGATFTVDAYPDRTFQARITQVRYGSETTGGVVTYETVLKVENTDLSLRPGMTATADITVQKVEDVLLIPNAALRFTPPVPEEDKAASGGGLLDALLPHPPRRESRKRTGNTGSSNQQSVWTLQGDQLVPVAVTTGVSDGTLTEVTAGDLSPGMPLVVDTVGGKR